MGGLGLRKGAPDHAKTLLDPRRQGGGERFRQGAKCRFGDKLDQRQHGRRQNQVAHPTIERAELRRGESELKRVNVANPKSNSKRVSSPERDEADLTRLQVDRGRVGVKGAGPGLARVQHHIDHPDQHGFIIHALRRLGPLNRLGQYEFLDSFGPQLATSLRSEATDFQARGK